MTSIHSTNRTSTPMFLLHRRCGFGPLHIFVGQSLDVFWRCALTAAAIQETVVSILFFQKPITDTVHVGGHRISQGETTCSTSGIAVTAVTAITRDTIIRMHNGQVRLVSSDFAHRLVTNKHSNTKHACNTLTGVMRIQKQWKSRGGLDSVSYFSGIRLVGSIVANLWCSPFSVVERWRFKNLFTLERYA